MDRSFQCTGRCGPRTEPPFTCPRGSSCVVATKECYPHKLVTSDERHARRDAVKEVLQRRQHMRKQEQKRKEKEREQEQKEREHEQKRKKKEREQELQKKKQQIEEWNRYVEKLKQEKIKIKEEKNRTS